MFFDNKKMSSIDPLDEHRDFRLLESFVRDAFEEQKKSRRWGIVFKSLTFAYLFFAMLVFFKAYSGSTGAVASSQPHTAMIVIKGLIADEEQAVASKINSALRKAFENEHAEAIMLVINTPGGSPVQSAYIYDEIRRLSETNPEKKVYAVIEDLGASGGYYVASAAHQIYANRSSLVGSIGVTASGFGFVDAMKMLGVERRHFTAGEHKAFLDPFSPLKQEEKDFWQDVLVSTHKQFIDAVEVGRGERLKVSEDISSGLIWNGQQALEMGLIDGLGSPSFVAREVIGQKEVVDYTMRPASLQTLIKQLGVSIGKGVAKVVLSSEIEYQLR